LTVTGGNVLGLYLHGSGGYAFVALLCAAAIPWTLNSLLVLLTKNLLPAVVPYLTTLLGVAAAWVALSAAFIRMNGAKVTPKGLLDAGVRLFVRGGAGALATVLSIHTLNLYFAGALDSLQATSPLLLLLVIVLVGLVESAGIALFLWIALGNKLKGIKDVQRLSIVAAGLFVALTAIPALLEAYSFAFAWTYASAPAKLAGIAIVALLKWLAIHPALCICASGSGGAALLGSGPFAGPGAAGKAALIAASAVLAASCVLTVMPSISYDPAEAVLSQVGDMIEQGDLYLMKGDLIGASASYRHAIARRDAWRTVLSGDGYLWQETKGTYNDTAVRLIYIEENKTLDRYLYSWILSSDCPVEFYVIYLDSLKEKEEALIAASRERDPENVTGLGEVDEDRRKDILLYLVLNGIWSGNAVMRADFDDEGAAALLVRLAEGYEEELSLREGVMLYGELVASGGVLSKEMAYGAVSIAARHPDNAYLQWMAMELGSSYTNDLGGNYYDEAAEAALLYDALFAEANPDAPDSEVIAQKYATATALMKCQRLKEAKDMLAEAIRKYDDHALRLLHMAVLYRGGEFEECARLAEAMVAKDGFDPEAMGLAMISRALNGELSASVTHALSLSKAAREGDRLVACDAMLLYFAHGIGGANIGDKRFPNEHRKYNMLSDDDKTLLERDPLLSNMLLAFCRLQEKKHEEAMDHVEAALRLGPGWPSLHYIKGAILFELLDYEAAIDSFLTAVSINRVNPGAWFMLGHCYDRLERYQDSLNAFTTVIEYIPNSEHMLDHYGLAYHSRKAINDLQRHVGKEAMP